mgnify:CR=1 FL=1
MQGRLIWLEAFQNKNALIISKHACELSCIKKSQAKAIAQVINRYNTQKERTESGSRPHTGYICYIQINLSNLIINLISREKQGFQSIKYQATHIQE